MMTTDDDKTGIDNYLQFYLEFSTEYYLVTVSEYLQCITFVDKAGCNVTFAGLNTT